MTDAELIEMIMMSADQIDASFEFWLTISFGVLIAVHVAKGTIGRNIKLLMCALYLACSLIAIISTTADIIQIVAYTERLDVELAATTWNRMVALLRLTVYVAGTLLIAISIFRYDTWFAGEHT